MAELSPRRPVSVTDALILGAIIAVLLAVAVPGYRRSGEIENAYRVKRELLAVELAVEQAAKEKPLSPGSRVDFEEYGQYIEKPRDLAEKGTDALGNKFGPQIVGQRPKVPRATVEHFSNIVGANFWDPYPTE